MAQANSINYVDGPDGSPNNCKQSVFVDLEAKMPWIIISHDNCEISLSVKNFNCLVSLVQSTLSKANQIKNSVNEIRRE